MYLIQHFCCLPKPCLLWILALINPEILLLTRIPSPSFVSKYSGIYYWATQNSYDLTVSLRKSFSLERGKLRTTSAATTSFHADPLLSYHSNCSFYIVRPYFDLIWNNFITGKQEWDDLNMNIIFHVKIPYVKYSQWRCLKKDRI